MKLPLLPSLCIALSLIFAISCEEPIPSDPLLYETIASENLKSFSSEHMRESANFDTYSEYLTWDFNNQKNLRPYDKRRSVFTLFENYEKKHLFKPGCVLDFVTWQDLNLLCGPRSNNTLYVAGKLARTSTSFGRITLYRMIVDPVADSKELRNRQDIVQELIQNTELFDKLNTAFEDLKNAENLLLSFWHNDAFKSLAQLKEIRFPYQPLFIANLNKNSVAVECAERLNQTRQLILLGCQAAAPLMLPTIAYFLITKDTQKADRIKEFASKHLGVSTIVGFMSACGLAGMIIKGIAGSNRWTEATNTLALAASYGNDLYWGYDQIKVNGLALRAIQEKLMAVAHYVRALKNFEELFSMNGMLCEKLPALQNIGHVLHETPLLSTDFRKLLNQLSTNTFKEQPSIFSYSGRVLAAFRLMNEQKDQLSEALIALGEVDAYMSIARLYKEGQRTSNSWCFAEFVENAQEPYIDIEDFWNPLLDPEKAIANSVTFGTKGNPRTLIITGPNAGGKSTTMMKGVPLCLLLAQSFGIAPAKKVRFTPFTKIMTYLNITDDIAAGNSHFKAGVLRAQKLVEMTKGLKLGEFGFVSIDEVFNGTTYKEGQAAAYSLIEFLGNHTQILCATATHFPLISNLEAETKGKLFKNYKVSVTYDEKGHILYPFKFEEGISHQNVALDILREEGFENDFLSRAHEILKRSAPAA